MNFGSVGTSIYNYLTNYAEYTYNMTSDYLPTVKHLFTSNSTAYSIPVQYLPNGIYWNGTIPNNPDTDQDELKDGQEFYIGTNPLNPDTDGDNVTDGKEVNGYELVWMETLPDGSVKDHKLKHVTSDPLDVTNGWRDIDEDGMPDYKEIHYKQYYPFLVKWANNQHIQNPNDFNATEYLKNQFNPFVKENIPPMLLTVSVNHWNEWGWEKCEIRARVYDAGGIGNLWIYHDYFGDFHSFKASNNGWYNVTLEIGWMPVIMCLF